MSIKLRLTGSQVEEIHAHLFPGDGREAVAFVLCGRHQGVDHHILLAHRLVPIPYTSCVRHPDRITWSTDALEPLLVEASRRQMALVKVHSHPGGYLGFSPVDDAADKEVTTAFYGWMDNDLPHASVVMTPDRKLIGRAVHPDGTFEPLASIAIAGHDLAYHYPHARTDELPAFTQRHEQVFGKATTQTLRRLAIAVVGCSGTGSPVIEQLHRLGVGRLVLVDPDRVEERNLNRILYATRDDVEQHRFKVDVLAAAIRRSGLGTDVVPIAVNLADPRAVRSVASCDLVVGCMDGAEGRQLLSRLATYYLLPYIDIGVAIQADGRGGVDQVCGAVHFLRPDGDTLMQRDVYDQDQVDAESLRRTSPDTYRLRRAEGYIRGVAEDRPAVISLNSQAASYAVNELLARLHDFRLDPSDDYAVIRFSLVQGELLREPETGARTPFLRWLGRGDVVPLLDRPDLAEYQDAA